MQSYYRSAKKQRPNLQRMICRRMGFFATIVIQFNQKNQISNETYQM